jgi:hypothetical protein
MIKIRGVQLKSKLIKLKFQNLYAFTHRNNVFPKEQAIKKFWALWARLKASAANLPNGVHT